MVCKLTQGVLRIALAVIRLCSGILRLHLGKGSSCSRLETKMEPARMRLGSEFPGSLARLFEMFCFTWLSSMSSDLFDVGVLELNMVRV